LKFAPLLTRPCRYKDFFPNHATYFPTFQKFAGLLSKIYDSNIDISSDPDKVHVQFICANKDNPYPTEFDPEGLFHKQNVKTCNSEDEGNIKKPDIFHSEDGSLVAYTDNEDEEDSSCLPSITLCHIFFEQQRPLDADDVTGWCTGHNDPNTPNYNFVKEADEEEIGEVDGVDSDDRYQRAFATWALALVHEGTHIDKLGVKAGRTGGTNLDPEVYERSGCRSQISDIDDDENLTFFNPEDNAESHAIALHGK
jgi:hypothetical protein